jgi:hypothetical protein
MNWIFEVDEVELQFPLAVGLLLALSRRGMCE